MKKRIILIISIITALIINIKNVDAAVSIKQESLIIGINYTQKLTVYGQTSEVSWRSSNTSIVTVDNGVVKGISPGKATVAVTDGTSTDTCEITVSNKYVPVSSISLSKSEETISINGTTKINVTINPSNASNDTVYYTVEKPTIASVDSNGNVTAKKIGQTYITVNVENKTETYKLTVVNSVNVALNGISIPNSLTLQEGNISKLNVTYKPSNATNKKVTWKSSNTNIITVDANGNVKAISSGTASVTATSSDGNHVATCKVTVTAIDKTLKSISLNKKELKLEIGKTETLTVSFTPVNAQNKNVTWKSSDDEIVTVENGKIKALKPGTAEIKVISEEGQKEAICKVTVTSAPIESISFSDEEITVYEDSVTTLVTISKPENTAIIDPIWTSSNEEVATVKDGVISAIKEGTTQITVSDKSGKITASINVKVIPKPDDKLTITVDNYDLGFDENTKNYTLTIGNETSLGINVNRAKNKYSIGGNRDLKNGSIITITINDKTKTTYVINIKKHQSYTLYFIAIVSVLLFINIIRILLKNKKKK